MVYPARLVVKKGYHIGMCYDVQGLNEDIIPGSIVNTHGRAYVIVYNKMILFIYFDQTLVTFASKLEF